MLNPSNSLKLFVITCFLLFTCMLATDGVPDASIFSEVMAIQLKRMEGLSQILSETDITYLVYYYRTSSINSRKGALILKNVAQKLDFLARIIMVDCDTIQPEEPEMCVKNPSSVDGYPKMELYEPPTYKFNPYTKELSAHVRKVYDKREVSDALIFNFITQNIPARTVKLTKDNFETFAINLDMNKVILFTDKAKTPLLFRGLSNFFYDQILFGEVTKEQTGLIKKFKIKNFPTLVVYQTHEEETPLDEPRIEYYTGKISVTAIVDFIAPYLLEEKLYLRARKTANPQKMKYKMSFKKLAKESVIPYMEKFKDKRFVIYLDNQVNTPNVNLTLLPEDIKKFNMQTYGFFFFIHLNCTHEEDFCMRKFKVKEYPSLIMLPNRVGNATIDQRLENEIVTLSFDYYDIVKTMNKKFFGEIKEVTSKNLLLRSSEAKMNKKVPLLYLYKDSEIPLSIFLLSSESKYTKFVDFLAFENPPADFLQTIKVTLLPQLLVMTIDENNPQSAQVIRYDEDLVYPRLRGFINQYFNTEKDTTILNDEEPVKRDVTFISNNEVITKHCFKNKKLCLIGFLDGRFNKNSMKAFDASISVLEDVNVENQKKPLSFGWVNATCQTELAANFNIDIGSLPNLIVYSPSKDVFFKFIGTYDKENISLFIDKVLQGKYTFTSISKDQVIFSDKKCEELRDQIEVVDDDELLKEIIEEEKKKRQEFEKEREELERAKKKKKKKSDL